MNNISSLFQHWIQHSWSSELMMSGIIWHTTLYTTFSTDSNPKTNRLKRGQILLHQVFPDCDVFTNCCRLPAVAQHQVRVCVYSLHATVLWPSLFPSRWTRVNTAVRSSATGPCAACTVCQSPASALTGPQTPVDSTPTCPSISQATSCLGNLKTLAPV